MKQINKNIKYFLFWLLAGYGYFAIDQLTKWLAIRYLNENTVFHPLPFVELFLTTNRGIAFGFLGEQGLWAQIFLLSVALVVCICILVAIYRQPKLSSTNFAYILIFGGALGNLVDRIRWGHVIDFITLVAGRWHWPTVFNMADIWITVGCLLLIFDIFRR
jgi:signal peptidase II